MNVLITAPSLDASKNVSGISAMSNSIITYNKQHRYFHYLLGSPDKLQNRLTRIINLFIQLLAFPFYLRQNKIGLVHQNLPLDPKGILRESVIHMWCWLFNIPVVLHIHGGVFIKNGINNLFYKNLVCVLFKYSKQVLVLSEIEKLFLNEKFGFSSAIVLSNSVDISLYSSIQSKKPNKVPNLLFLGRIEKNKGILELIDALKLLRMDFRFHFILCGTGPLVEYCLKECKIFLGSDFEYKGVVSGNKKMLIISQSDLFILPSYFEGLPMALLETMAAGVIPIVTNTGSMKYIVKHRINGLQINMYDSFDLYENLKLIISDNLLFESLSNNARKTIADNYNISNYITQLNDIYSTALIIQ